VYLAEIPAAFAEALQSLLRNSPQAQTSENEPESEAQRQREELKELDKIKRSVRLTRTTKRRLVASRIGQGKFRQNVEAIEPGCRVTGITDRRFLRASHIRPWRRSNNAQRLDGNNGLLLAAHIDHLFDGGYLSFTDEGDVIFSKRCPREIPTALGIRTPVNVGAFHPGQKAYLRYHRRHVFRGLGRDKHPTRSRATRAGKRSKRYRRRQLD
jgi:hypothetical protein